MTVILYRTSAGCFLKKAGLYYRLGPFTIDSLLSREDLPEFLASHVETLTPSSEFREAELLTPMGQQEVWTAGVTSARGRAARIEETMGEGAALYARSYAAERPELLFKSTPSRTVGTGQNVRLRSDAEWSTPDPVLTLVLSPEGRILGYTVGNDMGARDIAGENPLYLTQARTYAGSCALGPGILVQAEPPGPETEVVMEIFRGGSVVFYGSSKLGAMKRSAKSLSSYLMRDNVFPKGCFLMTGTGMVPPRSFTLESGDCIAITIEPIGTLVNGVAEMQAPVEAGGTCAYEVVRSLD